MPYIRFWYKGKVVFLEANMAVYLIPTSPAQQIFDIDLQNKTYTFRLLYNKFMETWTFDLYDENKNPLVMGAPLVTGVNLLDQYAYLGIKGQVVIYTEGDRDRLPSIDGLGVDTNIFFVEYDSNE